MIPPPLDESTLGRFILLRANRSAALCPPRASKGTEGFGIRSSLSRLHVSLMVPNLVRRRIVGHSLALLFLAATALGQNPPTTVAVDANANRHPINPNIYGICYGDANDMAALNAPLNRWGGNATSRYNWQIDAHSADSDWYFETYPDGPGTPSGSADAFVATTRSANNGAEPLITIPMLDNLANLGPGRTTLEGFSVKKYGAQTATDPWNPDAGNGVSAATGKNFTGNDPHDTGVANSTTIQQGWVTHFVSTLGNASTSGGIKYYILDNEPSLWDSTQRDVHPIPTTDEELFTKISSYATAIRAADPKAKIVGPEEWAGGRCTPAASTRLTASLRPHPITTSMARRTTTPGSFNSSRPTSSRRARSSSTYSRCTGTATSPTGATTARRDSSFATARRASSGIRTIRTPSGTGTSVSTGGSSTGFPRSRRW